jgi:hypothetical protein
MSEAMTGGPCVWMEERFLAIHADGTIVNRYVF